MFNNLRRSRRRLEDKAFLGAFEESQEAIIVLDAEERVYTMSRGAEKLLGYSREELNLKPWASILTSCGEDPWPSLKNFKAAHNWPAVLKVKDAGPITVVLEIQTLRSQAKDPPSGYLAWIAPSQNLEGLSLESRVLRETFLRLHRLGTVGQLAASFAHQMRSPLATIQSQAEFAVEFLSPSPKLRENLEMILRNVQRLGSTIDGLIRMAKSGSLALTMGAIGPILEAACRSIEPAANKQGVRITRRLETAPDLLRDPDLLHGALYNLLINAVEAMPSGGTLHVNYLPHREGFQIIIQDSGRGMNAAHLGHIGKPFFTTKEDGTGLGFYIARQIIESHGAKLQLTSSQGAGTTLSIIWPAGKTNP
ncbi:MAG: ATP-binding protein [Elusimicrobiota bacterium]